MKDFQFESEEIRKTFWAQTSIVKQFMEGEFSNAKNSNSSDGTGNGDKRIDHVVPQGVLSSMN